MFSFIGDIASSVIGAGASLINGKLNRDAQKDANEQNIALQREMNQQNQQNWQDQFDYTKEQNELTRQREDNAIQRQVADAEKAGISPLAVAGTGGASASTVNSAPSAPEMQAPIVQAPQWDMSVMNALFQHGLNAISQDRDLSSKEKIAEMQTSTQKFIAISQLENAKTIADQSNDTQLKIATNQLIELNRSNTAKEYQAKAEYFKGFIGSITSGHGRYKFVDDINTCRTHNEEISTRWAEFVKTLPKDSEASSSSSSDGFNVGADVNKNNGRPSLVGVVTKGIGVGANFGKNKSSSDMEQSSQTSSVQAMIKSFWLRTENELWIPSSSKGGF